MMVIRKMRSWLFVPFITNVLLLNTSQLHASMLNDEDHAKAQIEWINSSKGGYVNPKIEVRLANPNDPASRLAMFANADIAEKEPLITLSQDNIIDGNNKKIENKFFGIRLIEINAIRSGSP